MEQKKVSAAYKVIRWLVWLFSPKFAVEGTGNLPDEPCVIVGNHSHMYGPIACELYTPGEYEIWCNEEMMNRDEVADYAFRDFWSMRPKHTLWFYRILSHIIVPFSVIIFNNAHTIPVYRDTRLFTTFKLSLKALAEGKRIVIFPETYEKRNNVVCGFQKEFVDLARLYYRKTGRELKFVPMYVCPGLKTVYYGEAVSFRGEADIAEERERICEEVADRITRMAVALPRHKVVPYPNVKPREYRYNTPLEVYENEERAV